LFGIPAGEAMSYVRFLEAVHPEDRGRTDRAVRACLEGGDIEYRTLWPDGSIRWIHAKGSPSSGTINLSEWPAPPSTLPRESKRMRRCARASCVTGSLLSR
jgi:PAS domain-containing protein